MRRQDVQGDGDKGCDIYHAPILSEVLEKLILVYHDVRLHGLLHIPLHLFANSSHHHAEILMGCLIVGLQQGCLTDQLLDFHLNCREPLCKHHGIRRAQLPFILLGLLKKLHCNRSHIIDKGMGNTARPQEHLLNPPQELRCCLGELLIQFFSYTQLRCR